MTEVTKGCPGRRYPVPQQGGWRPAPRAGGSAASGRSGALSASLLLAGLLLAGPVAAQPYVYPANGQSQEQQQTDEAECSAWAQQQTGVDPSAPAAQVAQAQGGGEVVGGAAGGAALGAIGGAIFGDAGKGAAAGAAVGATRGLFSRFGRSREHAAAQSEVDAGHAAALQEYARARAACLTGRGYTVN